MVSAPTPGQAHLAAVGVPGDDRVVAVGGELVEHPQVRRVGDRQPQVGRAVGRAGDQVEAGRSPGAGRRRPRRRLAARRPSACAAGWSGRPSRAWPSAAARSGQGSGGARCAAARRRAGGSAAGCAGSARSSRWTRRRTPPARRAARSYAVEDRRHRVPVGQVVAGVDDQVGPQGRPGRGARPACGPGRGSCGCRRGGARRSGGAARRQHRHGHLGAACRPAPPTRRTPSVRRRRARPRRGQAGRRTAQVSPTRQGCHNGAHERPEGPTACRPDHRHQGPRRDPVLAPCGWC